MHAAYAFLVNSTDIEENGGAEAFFSTFYSQDYCDENNWWQAMLLVYQDGTIEPLATTDDYRGRNYLQEQYEAMPPEERWPAVLKFAADVVAIDLELYDEPSITLGIREKPSKISEMTAEELMNDIQVIIPDRIANFYKQQVGVTISSGSFNFEMWKTVRLVKMYEKLMGSTAKDFPFFTEPSSPYDSYRAMDLRPWQPAEYEAPDDNKLGILLVDIHT